LCVFEMSTLYVGIYLRRVHFLINADMKVEMLTVLFTNNSSY